MRRGKANAVQSSGLAAGVSWTAAWPWRFPPAMTGISSISSTEKGKGQRYPCQNFQPAGRAERKGLHESNPQAFNP